MSRPGAPRRRAAGSSCSRVPRRGVRSAGPLAVEPAHGPGCGDRRDRGRLRRRRRYRSPTCWPPRRAPRGRGRVATGDRRRALRAQRHRPAAQPTDQRPGLVPRPRPVRRHRRGRRPPVDHPPSSWSIRGWVPTGGRRGATRRRAAPPTGTVEITVRLRADEPASPRRRPRRPGPGDLGRSGARCRRPGAARRRACAAYGALATEGSTAPDGRRRAPVPERRPGFAPVVRVPVVDVGRLGPSASSVLARRELADAARTGRGWPKLPPPRRKPADQEALRKPGAGGAPATRRRTRLSPRTCSRPERPRASSADRRADAVPARSKSSAAARHPRVGCAGSCSAHPPCAGRRRTRRHRRWR